MPVVGYLNLDFQNRPFSGDGVREGLEKAGYVEGQNLTIEYRWANGENSKLSGDNFL